MAIFVTGTDTGVGKTIASAALLRRYSEAPGIRYWKPVQTGDDDDRLTVARLSRLGDRFTAPGLYRFEHPLSPHRAAELENASIDLDAIDARFRELRQSGPLIVEGAGGVMVPLNRQSLWPDLIERWQIPVVIATRTTLGTINHSLLTIAALRSRSISIAGLIFCGLENDDNERTIVDLSGVSSLGRIYYDPQSRFEPEIDADGLLAEALDAS